MIKIAPSILSADFGFLSEEISSVIAAGADIIHFDVMDGFFVPNISFGLPVLKSVRKHTDAFIDAHLMIEKPVRYVADFCKAGADLVTVHFEADTEANIIEAMKLIRACGKKAGIALNPQTPGEAVLPYLPYADLVLVMTVQPGFGGQTFMYDQLEKIRYVDALIQEQKLVCMLEIDGGVNAETARPAIENGANVIVAGSYVFRAADRHAAIMSLKD